MVLAAQVEMTKQELDAVAWRFLGSEFTAQSYANWPIDRRVDAYLLHPGLVEFVNDGAAYGACWNASWPASVTRSVRGYSRRRTSRDGVERPSVRQTYCVRTTITGAFAA